jgi:hypothetical protein
MKNTTLLGILRIMALVVLLAGAWESLHYVLLAGQNNSSLFLRGLFVAWVLLPFAALFTAGIVSRNWSVTTRATTYALMVLTAAGSFIAYSGMFSFQGEKHAAPFVLVPLLSLLVMMIGLPLSAFLARKEPD